MNDKAHYAMKHHIITETMILPAATDMVKTMCGEAEAQRLRSIPLSDNTVKQIIYGIASNQEESDGHSQGHIVLSHSSRALKGCVAILMKKRIPWD